MQTEHSPFPSDETLAAYIDGRLDEETRRSVVQHMAECPECLDIVMGNHELEAELKAATVVRGVNWRRNAYISLAAAAVLAAVFFLTPAHDAIFPPDGIKQLASVAPPKRSIDGRITSFPYREPATRYRGTTEEDVDLTLLSVAAKVQKRAEDHPNVRTLHAEGVAYLVTGHTPDAVRVLENVRAQTPSDPQLLSDLAAAYLAAGRAKDALAAASAAWDLAKTPEIAWNRAFALQRSGRRIDAIAAWNDYLAIKDSPEWSAEAKKQLDELRSE